jgi:hypothetical protein
VSVDAALRESASRNAADFAGVISCSVGRAPTAGEWQTTFPSALSDASILKSSDLARTVADAALSKTMADVGGSWIRVVAGVKSYKPGSTALLVVTSAQLVIGAARVGRDGTATIHGMFPVDKMGTGGHVIKIVGTRVLRNVSVTEKGRIVLPDSELSKVAQFDPKSTAVIRYTGNGRNITEEIDLAGSDPWWTLLSLVIVLLLALVLLGRRPAHRRRVESAMLVLTAAATVLTQYFGWTRVSYPVMAAGLVLAVVVAGVVLLVGSQDGETTPDEPTPA